MRVSEGKIFEAVVGMAEVLSQLDTEDRERALGVLPSVMPMFDKLLSRLDKEVSPILAGARAEAGGGGDLITVKEAAALAGKKIPTIFGAVRSEKLKAVRRKGRLLVHREDVLSRWPRA